VKQFDRMSSEGPNFTQVLVRVKQLDRLRSEELSLSRSLFSFSSFSLLLVFFSSFSSSSYFASERSRPN
jgi:hypothetical protein